ncbi:hypothetical protein Tco_0555614 [Tanacetum coccineum]
MDLTSYALLLMQSGHEGWQEHEVKKDQVQPPSSSKYLKSPTLRSQNKERSKIEKKNPLLSLELLMNLSRLRQICLTLQELKRTRIVNPRNEVKAITTRSGLAYDGPLPPMPPPFVNPDNEDGKEVVK